MFLMLVIHILLMVGGGWDSCKNNLIYPLNELSYFRFRDMVDMIVF